MSAPAPAVRLVPRAYVLVFVALIALLATAVAIPRAGLGAFAQPATYAIASAKALLVVTWFMHAKRAERLVWCVLGAVVIWWALLAVATLHDATLRQRASEELPAIESGTTGGGRLHR